MKTKSLLYTVLISIILIFSPSLSLSQIPLTAAPVGEATTPLDGFCCSNGQVVSSSHVQCKKRGQYYQTRAEALRHCKPNTVFCCINGKVSEVSPEQCKRSQGTAYSTDAEAKRKCKSEAIYCCQNGKIVKVSPGDCKKKRGTAYATSPEAKRKCKPEEVYCCLKGSIKKVSTAECKTKKGESYRSERGARKNCGWCCAESKVFPTTPNACKRKRGKYFTSKVLADQQCKEQPQCCVEGKLVRYSQRECIRKKGKYYRSYLEAKRSCRVIVKSLRQDVLPKPAVPEVIEPPMQKSIPDSFLFQGGKVAVAANGLTGPSSGVGVGTLTVLVDRSTPVSSIVPGNASGVLYTVWRLEASDDEPINVEGLTVSRVGLGLPKDFDELKLYVDSVQQGSQKSINSATNSAGFTLVGAPIQVPAGGKVLVRVVGDMDTNKNTENALCINSSEDVTAVGVFSGKFVSVAGSFAVCGAYMYTSSGLPDDDSQPSDYLRPTISEPDHLWPRIPSSTTPGPPPLPELESIIFKPMEAILFVNTKASDPFQVSSVQFATVTNPATNQTHLAAGVIFNKNINAATVRENNNIRLLKQDEETTFWHDVATQNNVLKIGPNYITWLSGAQLANGKYKMHLRGTIESENGTSLDCDGDGVGEGGALPAHDSQIYQVNGVLQSIQGLEDVYDMLLDY